MFFDNKKHKQQLHLNKIVYLEFKLVNNLKAISGWLSQKKMI